MLLPAEKGFLNDYSYVVFCQVLLETDLRFGSGPKRQTSTVCFLAFYNVICPSSTTVKKQVSAGAG